MSGGEMRDAGAQGSGVSIFVASLVEQSLVGDLLPPRYHPLSLGSLVISFVDSRSIFRIPDRWKELRSCLEVFDRVDD